MLMLRSPFSDSNVLDHFLDEITGSVQFPYWRNADHNSFNFSDNIGEIVNDESKFSVQLDVSHFKPEDLKIELDGRELKIEGIQEKKSEHGYSKRSFSKMILLPEDVDLTSVKSAISNEGKLQIEAPKKTNSSRSIPINFVAKH
ncbi:Heat shock protein Hsp-16.48/Hsp-16.49 [Caenorhabditis elegans]|uniref:Heat shock protein Hsp-16.48/Hsp-16.49 n=2 Tax=Caenorhabditis elegans TaxID=6239 RepID=HSP17_CAEEL|nr:Heat shock protein Hsp-16.48/Hsp-16.49 [Caenorhabditis elegans]NP_505356.1 Heat shock protein Hsp-16.48/Hsp-16.49 [Caenorhabditis elegans]P02513.1 RecName: Full=Heat shock protein Hsp-16.48/Hsp-16.49 [Caenorhabditis elegans]AAA28069.1 heat shock protein 16-48 [Caenorhabditis elegans]CCD65663.1 Heat shock protein Hsp-16.48/Hsp-16.49 [Caenorhabditis elegans]CCD65669.1 Heat shock protein Hsp-16.48/Hsp-16.49 [Caenorhabditis elegans]|eukprot:NP_505355.1 Heat shock protein Hsp-16.48/Hsp-16.49 [Caenorhabditis elegans]